MELKGGRERSSVQMERERKEGKNGPEDPSRTVFQSGGVLRKVRVIA
jgi:hypothetical protein